MSQANKQTLIDAVVHAVNEDYEEMAKDFIKLVRPLAWAGLCIRATVESQFGWLLHCSPCSYLEVMHDGAKTNASATCSLRLLIVHPEAHSSS